MSFPTKSGTVVQITEVLLETWGENTMAAEILMKTADKMGLFHLDLYAGPERTADRQRLLTASELAQLRTVFELILRAIDDLPPEAIKKREQFRVVEGGDS